MAGMQTLWLRASDWTNKLTVRLERVLEARRSAKKCYDSRKIMAKKPTMPHRRPKSKRPFKVVIYLSEHENEAVERAAAISARSKSAFGADVILKEARRILDSAANT